MKRTKKTITIGLFIALIFNFSGMAGAKSLNLSTKAMQALEDLLCSDDTIGLTCTSPGTMTFNGSFAVNSLKIKSGNYFYTIGSPTLTGSLTLNFPLTGTPGQYLKLSDVNGNTEWSSVVGGSFDSTTVIGSQSWGDGSTDTIVWTWDRLTGTDPTMTILDGKFNFTALQSGGVDVLTAEVDGSTTNEINTITGDNAATTSGLAITIAGAGTVSTAVAGDTLTITGAGGQTMSQTFSFDGIQYVRTGALRWMPPANCTIVSCTAAVNTAPTDASLIYDVNREGVTIFTTQGNRPTITTGNFVSTAAVPDVTSLSTSQYLTVDCDQIGSSVAGSDCTLRIIYTIP